MTTCRPFHSRNVAAVGPRQQPARGPRRVGGENMSAHRNGNMKLFSNRILISMKSPALSCERNNVTIMCTSKTWNGWLCRAAYVNRGGCVPYRTCHTGHISGLQSVNSSRMRCSNDQHSFGAMTGEGKDSEETSAGSAEGTPRRTVSCTFTCNKCEARTERFVNPHALAKGTVYVQCGECNAFHQLVDNLDLVQEYNLRQEEE